jgi:AraC family ethanolamine operon transcriptional activator
MRITAIKIAVINPTFLDILPSLIGYLRFFGIQLSSLRNKCVCFGPQYRKTANPGDTVKSPNPFILHLDFDDVDALGESIPDWNVEFRQLDRGSFRGSITQIARDGWVLSHASIKKATEQVGLPPSGMRTVVITNDKPGTMQWRGHAVSANDLMIFPENGELYAVGDRNFNIFTLSFMPEDLGDPDLLTDKGELLHVAPREMASLRRSLSLVMRTSLMKDEDHPLRPNPLHVLRAVLAGASDSERLCSHRKRDRALAEAIKLLQADRFGVMSIGDLSKRLQVSARTLDAAFLDCFGITPASYRKALRLNAVHCNLRRADPATTRVQDVARDFGFVHMSQFATDYRQHFGLLPSESLHSDAAPLFRT